MTLRYMALSKRRCYNFNANEMPRHKVNTKIMAYSSQFRQNKS